MGPFSTHAISGCLWTAHQRPEWIALSRQDQLLEVSLATQQWRSAGNRGMLDCVGAVKCQVSSGRILLKFDMHFVSMILHICRVFIGLGSYHGAVGWKI